MNDTIELKELILLILYANGQAPVRLPNLLGIMFLFSKIDGSKIMNNGKEIISQEIFDEFDEVCSWELFTVKLKNKYKIVL
jgi:hypothetical protein